ncbi:hypothetical protein M0R45_026716 [Rubus argutus]|uniref:Uncharacterized protein n=1 Tax=Rubus argutus TaxID=59490 RepID=A0AAW1WZ02_RUBAR
MVDPFLSLVKTRCWSFSSFLPTHIPSSSRPLHNKLRTRAPLGFPKPGQIRRRFRIHHPPHTGISFPQPSAPTVASSSDLGTRARKLL